MLDHAPANDDADMGTGTALLCRLASFDASDLLLQCRDALLQCGLFLFIRLAHEMLPCPRGMTVPVPTCYSAKPKRAMRYPQQLDRRRPIG
jgi:hypothetical protein